VHTYTSGACSYHGRQPVQPGWQTLGGKPRQLLPPRAVWRRREGGL